MYKHIHINEQEQLASSQFEINNIRNCTILKIVDIDKYFGAIEVVIYI